MGYFLIDYTGVGEGKKEADTIACPHCQGVIFKKDILIAGGGWKCSECKKYLCKTCSAWYGKNPITGEVQVCDPWQEKIERDVANATKIAREGGWA